MLLLIFVLTQFKFVVIKSSATAIVSRIRVNSYTEMLDISKRSDLLFFCIRRT